MLDLMMKPAFWTAVQGVLAIGTSTALTLVFRACARSERKRT